MNYRLLSIFDSKRMLRLVFILAFVFPLTLSAQEWSKVTKRCDAVYETNEFFKAYNMYKEAYKKVENKQEKTYIAFQMAQCLRFMNQTVKAEAAYLRAITRGYPDPMVYYYYAEMLKKNTKYTEAAQNFEEYSKRVPGDKKGTEAAVGCRMAAEWMASPTRYVIENRKELNSKEGEFAAAYASADFDVIYFTSTRTGIHGNKINPVTGDNYTDIFETRLEKKGTWSKPEAVNDTVNSVNDDGTPAFGGDNFNNLYFTRCKIVRGMKLGCQIYLARRQPGDDWLNVDGLAIAHDSISIAHPTLSKDGLTMYFVSDMAGGFGGNDIYMITRKSKTSNKWEAPVNMGMDINTAGNEVFPFIRENGILYFASDYHPGMGGLDIFKATRGEDDRWVVENMRYPINSPADDFAIVFKGNKEEGLFSSSRKAEGAKGKDDIYSFVLPPMEFILEGRIIDDQSEKSVPSTRIKIMGSDGTDLDITTKEDGSFRYKLNPHTDYVYVVKKEGYLNSREKVSTAEMADSKTFTHTIRMSSITSPVEVENVFYDFGKWELREESKKELDHLVQILNTNPNITIELGSHTDMVGDSLSNMILSQRRAQSVVDYLLQKGIAKDRLVAKGYGKSVPKTITAKLAKSYPFKEGDVLTEDYIRQLATDELKEKANQINRRTEFKVLSTNYIPEIED